MDAVTGIEPLCVAFRPTGGLPVSNTKLCFFLPFGRIGLIGKSLEKEEGDKENVEEEDESGKRWRRWMRPV